MPNLYKPAPTPEKYEKFKEVMGWLNDLLKPTGYIAGTEHLTVADISLLARYDRTFFRMFSLTLTRLMHLKRTYVNAVDTK